MSDTAPSRPQHQAKLVAGSIPRHLIGQTLPMIIGVAAMMSIGLVDAYFIGQLGSEALAAISFIFPISVAITSLGVGVMVGINSVVARALGENDLHKAARRANLGIVFALVCGAVMGFTLYVLLDSLFALMNASPELLPIIKIYMEPFALGFPIMLAIMGLNGVMRGQGEARKTSIVSLAYAAANWVLDPILITGAFGFEGLGMVDGNIEMLNTGDLPSPHMGWNKLSDLADDPLLAGIGEGDYAYFVHSFAAPISSKTIASAKYGNTFSAIVRQGNVYGCQFHPERSAKTGAKIFKNFLKVSA